MKSILKSISSIFIILTIFISCQTEYLPESSVPSGSSSTAVTAPTSVSASQGLKNKITLSWESVPNAKWYKIYYAPNQYADFSEIAVTDEVTSEKFQTSYDIQVMAGSKAWYEISAVDASGNESEVSSKVMGTSLACPLISSIESDDASTSTIYWYMNNVTEDSYQSSLMFTVICSDGSKVIYEEPAEGTVSSWTFTDLSANTTYYYTVQAYLKGNQNDSETSNSVSSTTSLKQSPDCPVSLTASQGSSTTGITLSWTLPDEIEIEDDSGSILPHDLYFKISRRLEGETDWNEYVSYYGFKSYEALISGTALISDSNSLTEYSSGETVSWTDNFGSTTSTAEKYEYLVQSYVDFDEDSTDAKVITSDESSATASGWLMPVPYFNTKNYSLEKTEVTDEDEVTAYIYTGTSEFSLSWDNLESQEDYFFVIKENHRLFSLDNNDAEDAEGTDLYLSKSGDTFETPVVLDSVDTVNSLTRIFNMEYDNDSDSVKVRGYYSYTIYIIPSAYKDSIDTALSSVSAQSSEITVSNSDFKVTAHIVSGYSDHFEIYCTEETGYTYTYSYTPIINGTVGDSVITVPAFNEEKECYDDEAESGDRRIYTITATDDSTGLPASLTLDEADTLGTPEPLFNSSAKSYKDITVYWQKVQMASSYKIKLDDNEEITVTDSTDNCTYDSAAEKYSYTFKDTDSTDSIIDASKAGSSHTVYLTAYSEEDSSNYVAADSTSASVNACTMGSASLNLSATQGTDEDTISLTWESVTGAAKYVIQRTAKSLSDDGTNWESGDSEIFTVTGTSSPSVSNDEGTIEEEDFTVTSAEKEDGTGWTFTLTMTDPYTLGITPDEDSIFGVSQSTIGWGIPYEFTVIPLISEDDECDFGDSLTINNEYVYSGLSEITETGSTTGYGLNVEASKSESLDEITITWKKPYAVSDDAYPVIQGWIKGSESGSASITKYGNTDDVSFTLNTLSVNDVNVYNFKVQYRLSSNAKSRIYDDSYSEKLSSELDENGEQNNSGYLFSLPEMTFENEKAEDGYEGFTEKPGWTLWSFEDRKTGPSSVYTVYSKNLNNSSEWFEIAEISNNGTDAGNTMTVCDSSSSGGRDWYNCSFNASPEKDYIEITPYEGAYSAGSTPVLLDDTSTDDHDGLLKVQRDYLHYYRITATRTNSDGETLTLTREVSGYRRISGSEFIHNVLLIVAEGTNQSGVNDNADKNTDGNNSNGYRTAQGKTGVFMVKHETNTKTLKYGTDGYDWTPYFYDLPGQRSTTFTSAWTINFDNASSRAAVDAHKIYYFPSVEITVTHSSGLPSYEGTVQFTAGTIGSSNLLGAALDSVSKSYSVSASASQNTGLSTSLLATDDETAQEAIFPFVIGLSRDTSYTTYNEELASYNNRWWEVKE